MHHRFILFYINFYLNMIKSCFYLSIPVYTEKRVFNLKTFIYLYFRNVYTVFKYYICHITINYKNSKITIYFNKPLNDVTIS